MSQRPGEPSAVLSHSTWNRPVFGSGNTLTRFRPHSPAPYERRLRFVRAIIRFLSDDGLHDLRISNFAKGGHLRQTDGGGRDAWGGPQGRGETSRLPADSERHDHRARSGKSNAVFDTAPMPIQRRTCDTEVDVHDNSIRTCMPPIPQVAGGLGFAWCPQEHRCRAGLQADDGSDPPLSMGITYMTRQPAPLPRSSGWCDEP